MELLGRETAGVVSVACSSASTTSFATLSALGHLTLWDVRLPRKKNYLSCPNTNRSVGAEASELRYLPDRHAAVALCGNTVQLFDTRKGVSCVSEYTHDKECVTFLKAEPPADASTILLCDEDGGLFSYDFTDGSRPRFVESYVWEHRYPLPNEGRFGSLSNYSSGLHSVDIPMKATKRTTRYLLTVGMDGEGALYSHTESATDVERIGFSLGGATSGGGGGAPMVNPPLVNCTAVCGTQLAAGRADGMYSIYDIEQTGVDQAMAAPGHAVNGLCYLDWVSSDVLLTTSLCGEVTGWAVGAFLAVADQSGSEDEEDIGIPAPVAALAHREVIGCENATVNCGDRLRPLCYVFGDHLGGVTLAQLNV